MKNPIPSSLSLALLLTATAIASVTACTSKLPDRKVVTLNSMLNEAKNEGLELKNPIEINEEMKKDVLNKVGLGGTPIQRVKKLISYLTKDQDLNFNYSSDNTYTAIEAFNNRKGDCLSYSNLYVGLARFLKLHVYFVDIDEAPHFFEKDGKLYRSSHIAVAYAEQYTPSSMNPFVVIVDFSQESSQWKLWLYQLIDDPHALALFYNNIATEHMAEGDLDYADKLLSFLLREQPDVKELYNNLAVVKIDKGQYYSAIDILDRGIKKFPDYRPYYTNAVQAARLAKEPTLAAEYSLKGQSKAAADPFFLFNSGVKEYNEGDYKEAEQLFQNALKQIKDSPFLYAWLARVYMKEGDSRKGIEAFMRVQKLAPNHPMLIELRANFPDFRKLPPPNLKK